MNLSLQQKKQTNKKKLKANTQTPSLIIYFSFILGVKCGTAGQAQEKTLDSGVAIPLSSCTLDKHSVRPHCPNPQSEEWDRSP